MRLQASLAPTQGVSDRKFPQKMLVGQTLRCVWNTVSGNTVPGNAVSWNTGLGNTVSGYDRVWDQPYISISPRPQNSDGF